MNALCARAARSALPPCVARVTESSDPDGFRPSLAIQVATMRSAAATAFAKSRQRNNANNRRPCDMSMQTLVHHAISSIPSFGGRLALRTIGKRTEI